MLRSINKKKFPSQSSQSQKAPVSGQRGSQYTHSSERKGFSCFFTLWREEDKTDQDSQLPKQLFAAADGNRDACFCQYRTHPTGFYNVHLPVCCASVFSFFLKKALNCYDLPHNYHLNESEVFFRHVQSTLIQKGFYSHFYCEKAAKSSSGRKRMHDSFCATSNVSEQ